WTQVVCFLALSALGTVVWSMLDRRRANHVVLDQWLRLAVRIALGSTFIIYGIDKLVPLQMPYPGLLRLIEPYGNLSPMGVLWAFIGASPAYEIFTGFAETLGGVLVLLPRTALLGTLVCLIVAIQIFALNMTYDVPVKLLSFHLILLAVYLLAPDWPRLRDLLLLDRAAGPSTQPALFRSPRANRITARVLAVYLVYVLGMNLRTAAGNWTESGGAAPRPPFYGIWNVETMTVDGVTQPALVSDSDRWRRVVFQYEGAAAVQRMDDSFLRFAAELTVQ